MPAYDSTTSTQEPPPAHDPPGQDVAINEGARLVPDRATFETLARADDGPGQLGAEEMKILILGVDTEAPELYFLNTNAFAFHYDFATEVLHVRQDLGEFNGRTYFGDDRSNLAATIIADDHFQPADSSDAGLYALEFWPTDPVRAKHVALAFDLVSQAMPFAAGKLAHHPAGDTQEALYAQDRDALAAAGVRSVLTAELFADVSHVALNLGEGYGVHVAGVISATPQTPLSHINLEAKQNDTPNAYVRDAASEPRMAAPLGQVVRYAVTPDDVELAAASYRPTFKVDAAVKLVVKQARPWVD